MKKKPNNKFLLILVTLMVIPLVIQVVNNLISSSIDVSTEEYLDDTTNVQSSALNDIRLDGLRIGTVITHGERNPRTYYPIVVTYLLDRGATVTDISSTLTSAVLNNYDLLWFDESGSTISSTELDAIQTWVSAGGCFLITGDNGGSTQGLTSRYSITYSLLTHSSGTTTDIYSHPITQSVNSLYFPGPYAYLDIASQPAAVRCARINSRDMVVAMESGSGRFVIILDEFMSSPTTADNQMLINNTFGWFYPFINDFSPELTSGMVSPGSGNQSTLFNFSVNYTDADNNPPQLINVSINGTEYPMERTLYNTTSLEDFDGYTSGQLIKNQPRWDSNEGGSCNAYVFDVGSSNTLLLYDPDTSCVGAWYEFPNPGTKGSVKFLMSVDSINRAHAWICEGYSDAIGGIPSQGACNIVFMETGWIRVMNGAASVDLITYSAGEIYEIECFFDVTQGWHVVINGTPYGTGVYCWAFENGNPVSINYFNPGTNTNQSGYNVFYDVINATMMNHTTSILNYTEDILYECLIYLQPGTHDYYFQCYDGKFTNSTGIYTGLVVGSNNVAAPILGNPKVSPSVGFADYTNFSYSVVYSDSDNNAPISMDVVINNVSYSMDKVDPLDSNYMDGCLYGYNTTLSLDGYSYYFECDDGTFNDTIGPFSGPGLFDIDNPILSNGLVIYYPFEGDVTDHSGNGYNGYSYGNTYDSGVVGQAASFDGNDYVDTNVYNTNSNYTLCTYFKADLFISNPYTNSPLIDSYRSGYYGTGMGVSATTITIEYPYGYVTHNYNFSTGEWYYLVVTFDRSNNKITSYVNGTKVDETTVSFSNPLYFYDFYIGRHRYQGYYFTGLIDEVRIYNRALSQLEVSILTNSLVNDYSPELTSQSVDPPSGNQSTLFNFNVVYTDADNNAPTFVNVSLNGTTYTMERYDMMDNNFTDGCTYQFLTYLAPDLYNYSFSCSDSVNSNSSSWQILNVSYTNTYAPALTGGSVNPVSGLNDSTLFIFNVNYTDADNNPAESVNLTVGMVTLTMNKVDPLDNNYIDGCLFTVNTTLCYWDFYYHFNCSDGGFTSSTTPTHGPVTDPKEVLWYRTWHGNYYDYGRSVWTDGDDVYVCGDTSSIGAGNYDMLLVKWDKDGNQVWQRTYGGSSAEYGFSVCGDGEYIYTAGYTYSFGAGSYDFLLVKWDEDGNQIWSRTWGGTGYDYGRSVWCADNYIYLVGETASFGAGNYDMGLVKWDADGNQVWNQTWGGSNQDYGRKVWADESSIYVCGETYSFGAGNYDMVTVKWDVDGNQEWNQTWGGTSNEYGYSIWGDGSNIYSFGSTYSFGPGNSDFLLVKYDSLGNQLWNKTWGGTNTDYGREVWGDGNHIYTCGETYSFGAGYYDFVVIEWDEDGNQIWNETFGDPDYDYCESVHGYGDYIYLAGHTENYGAGGSYDDFLLVKMRVRVSQELLTPLNGTFSFNTVINFSWTNLNLSCGPVNYTWQISDSPLFSVILGEVNDIVPTGHIINFSRLVNFSTGQYYWRVCPTFNGVRSFWTSPFMIDLMHNDYAPTLTNMSLNPSTGSQYTAFNFSVLYTDLDDNPPVSINVLINGTSHVMEKVDPLDLILADGCLYQCITNLSYNGTYNYSFTCYDGKFSNSTNTLIGPVVNLINNFAPELLNPTVTPTIGGASTMYNFTIVYQDADCNYPDEINITISGSTYPMVEADESDVYLVNGKVYYYATLLPYGFHQFQVNCSNGIFTNSTQWVQGLEVSPLCCISSNCILINEINTNDNYIELYNYGQTRDMSYWSIRIYYNGLLQRNYLFPFGWDFESHSALVLREGSGVNINTFLYSGWDIYWEYAGIAIGLFNKDGSCVDWFQTSDFNGDLPLNADWGQDKELYFNATQKIACRSEDYDMDLASDWTMTSSTSEAALNPGQTGSGGSFLILNNPVDGFITSYGDVEFSWENVAGETGAVSYTIQISSDPGFSTIVYEKNNVVTLPVETSDTVNVDFDYGLYYWRVRTTVDQFIGEWSEVKEFNVQQSSLDQENLLFFVILLSILIGAIAVPIGIAIAGARQVKKLKTGRTVNFT